MTGAEIVKLTNKYIGVTHDGYLCDFTYQKHKEFYPLFCDLDINPENFTGSTRSRFQQILSASDPDAQAKIVRGILAKCPPQDGHTLRTQEAHDEFLQVARRLEGLGGVGSCSPTITSEIVERAIADTEHLIKTTGATSGVDRVHTMLHGYMKAVCDDAGISYSGDPTILALFKLIREQHPAIAPAGPRAQDITQILKTLGSILDVLNPIRNNASMAHANDLLDPAEAMLVINSARTILHYIDAKLAD